MERKRKRGGQPGNQNALKHGYYSTAFKKADLEDFNLASGVRGFDEEIALLRFQIKKAITEGDTKALLPLVKAAGALEKLIRTDFKVNGAKNRMVEGLKNLMRDSILPMGDEQFSIDTVKRWCGYPVDNGPFSQRISNTPGNEADFP